ncbi:MAG: phosphonate ABC transporter ATP-binding protein [Microcoleus sp.]
MTIECSNLETAYSPSLNRPILNKIDCTIKQGEFVALLGLNGAGKSTFLRSFVGLVPCKKGEIRINDTIVNSRTIARIRHDVGMIFQGGGLVKQLPAIDNVLCGCLGSLSTWQTLWGFPKKQRDRALELLDNFGLGELAYQTTGKLSGGQQQKVAIARALIQSPKILLADEPTTGLDVIAAQQVMEILARLHRDRGMTVVTVLHDLGMASTYPERAIVLDAGQIAYDGNCHNLADKFSKLNHPKIVENTLKIR